MAYHEEIETLRKFITSELGMRRIVFKNSPAKLQSKVAEADKALDALDRLAGRLADLERDVAQPRQIVADFGHGWHVEGSESEDES